MEAVSGGESQFSNGTSSFTQSGGTHSVASLVIGGDNNGDGGDGVYALSAGRLTVTGTESIGIGLSGSGSFTQTGGTHSVNDLVIGAIDAKGAGGNGSYSLSGGLLTLSGLSTTGGSGGASAFEFSSGTFQAGASFSTSLPLALGSSGSGPVFDTQANTLTLAGALSGSGGFQKIGSGTLVVSASNSYTGSTTISAGTLQIGNGGTSGNIPGAIINNATLALDRSDVYYTLGSNISGSGSLAMEGTGTLALSGTIPSANVTVNQGQIETTPGSQLTCNLTTAVAGRFTNNGGNVYLANLTNAGTFIGGGQVGGTFVNQSTGDVRIAGGQDLYLSGGGSQSNQGLIQVLGTQAAQAQFESAGPLTNSAGGTSLVAAQNATLYFDAGLTNSGAMSFSYGLNSVFGNATNSAGGSITITGGAGATFYGNVVQNGTLNVAAVGNIQSSAVFLGAYSGSGSVTGSGDVFFQGDLRPGDAPAAINFGGNVYLAPTTNTVIDITGTTAGLDYDQVNVAGTLGLAGSLTVTLSNSAYRPGQGTQFEILSFGTVTGSFAAMDGLNLGNRLNLVPTFTSNGLILTAVQGGSGSWNLDGNGAISVAANWAGGVPSEAGDAATFGPVISAPRTVTVDVPTTFGSMIFQSSQGYTIAGSNSITLDMPGGSPQITVLAGSQTIAAPLVLEGNLSIGTSAGDSLDLSGGISGGTASLTLSGGGELILSGSASYSGGTLVEAGTLVVTAADALPSGSSLTVGAAPRCFSLPRQPALRRATWQSQRGLHRPCRNLERWHCWSLERHFWRWIARGGGVGIVTGREADANLGEVARLRSEGPRDRSSRPRDSACDCPDAPYGYRAVRLFYGKDHCERQGEKNAEILVSRLTGRRTFACQDSANTVEGTHNRPAVGPTDDDSQQRVLRRRQPRHRIIHNNPFAFRTTSSCGMRPSSRSTVCSSSAEISG